MNVYDFDQTIFYSDSSFQFTLYCLRHYPRCVLPALPKSLWPAAEYLAGSEDVKKLKEQIFSFLSRLPDVEQIVEDFWAENSGRIRDWYLRQKRPDDLIISASPAFLLGPIARKLGVTVIATNMDPYTGRIYGRNCHDTEKVRRFREQYPDALVEQFYSDSLSDAPMAELAQQAFLVKRDEIVPWP